MRRDGSRLVRVDEAGEAIDDAGVFRAQPIEIPLDLAMPDDAAIDAAAREIESIVKPPLVVERLHVSEANVAHECDGIRWSETLRRVHVSIALPPIRALIDLAVFRFDVVRRVADALKRAGGERDAPKRIRVAENVGAALLPFVRIDRVQTAAPYDGKGRPVVERRIDPELPPNWFRPSYRLRPRRAWFHLRAEPFGSIERDLPEAVALLGPVGERVHVLCIDGNRVYPASFPLGPVAAADPKPEWYPYAAGAFGTELMF